MTITPDISPTCAYFGGDLLQATWPQYRTVCATVAYNLGARALAFKRHVSLNKPHTSVILSFSQKGRRALDYYQGIEAQLKPQKGIIEDIGVKCE